MWIILAAWLLSLVGITFFLAGTKRYRDGEEAEPLELDPSRMGSEEAGRLSDVYYVGEAPHEQRGRKAKERVA